MPRWLVGVLLVLAVYFPAAWWASRSYVDITPKGKTVVMLIRPFERYGHAAVAREWTPVAQLPDQVVVYENGDPLDLAVNGADIAAIGHGRYSHQAGIVIFSASDETDPNTNGRHYWAVVP